MNDEPLALRLSPSEQPVLDGRGAQVGESHGVRVRRAVAIASRNGPLRLVSFSGLPDRKEHLAILFGDHDSPARVDPPLVRIHSECLTGDLLGSAHCDCGPQLAEAIELCRKERCGAVLYMRDEGRGIGLYAKLDAYQLQAEGLDTFQANEALGFPADARDFSIAAEMLKALGITAVRLLTNNPSKVEALRAGGIVVEAIRTGEYVTPENLNYLNAKRHVACHTLLPSIK